MNARFGIQLTPVAAETGLLHQLARRADEEGLDLLGVQDHPYAADHLDAFSLLGTVLAETEHLRVFPDVASLPLRGPAMIAKAAASLDRLSDGRFELALGSGAFWPAIAAMGGPRRSSPEALAALAEGIEIIRAMWRPGDRVKLTGGYYTVQGVHAGPAPAHPIGIWVGSVGPKAHALTGRLADGWAAPIPHYLPYEKWPEAQGLIDSAAHAAGRDPAAITRVAQIVGDITAEPADEVRLLGEEPVRASVSQWVDVISRVRAMGFDSFVYWPETADMTQLLRWAGEVIPGARALLAESDR